MHASPTSLSCRVLKLASAMYNAYVCMGSLLVVDTYVLAFCLCCTLSPANFQHFGQDSWLRLPWDEELALGDSNFGKPHLPLRIQLSLLKAFHGVRPPPHRVCMQVEAANVARNDNDLLAKRKYTCIWKKDVPVICPNTFADVRLNPIFKCHRQDNINIPQ